jgi:pimeloyl-ACP methyl ester carboxylesterase
MFSRFFKEKSKTDRIQSPWPSRGPGGPGIGSPGKKKGAFMVTRVFLHGLESSGRGTKGRFFRDRYPRMIVEDFFGSFHQRMEKLEALLADKDPLILVGSSFGGLMAAVYAGRHEQRVKRMILLAPALAMEPYRRYLPEKSSVPVTVYHGRKDEVVPLKETRDLAEGIFTHLVFHEVDDDHLLRTVFPLLPWDELLAWP